MTETSHPFDGGLAKRRRIMAGLTQQELATRMAEQGHEVHWTAISKVELGTNFPSGRLMLAMARALDCSVEDLCNAEAGAA